ncbi:hypothetical protein ASPWEDRAFT_39579 [Aspergillus wentii DTO 134E9]|uniref:Rhodopsin domain-containing protein n=1 Tax=Aspergillus wentii DTO 134E9 TaxID=1073089 RepID=A0A1L9RSE5_ASPWE|nr:uncharacterized protein ASPWEDRAFT_39579 [Aspergillus wentii DTO 134E9]KAI9930682.1 hypothetical protein MW887_011437 [Aspergillus wentii]OJJ37845.1 hypothetical protein ASPWEDRAFT_39579 [Aspergillus wentii DTO 134E9]
MTSFEAANLSPAASTQARQRRTTIVMCVIALLFTILRVISRKKQSFKLAKDDWALFISLGFVYTLSGLNFGLVHNGMGLHQAALPAQNLIVIHKILLAFECIYTSSVAMIKISVLLMYHRILRSERSFRIAALILGLITIGWWISIVCVCIFQCNPIAKAWNIVLPGTCINLRGSFIGNGVPNIATDVAILSLPAPQVWKLHTSVLNRLGVIAIFGLGSFVLAASIYRFSTLFAFDIMDLTWTLATPCTWCVVECAMGVTCACLPTLRPLFKLVSAWFGCKVGAKDSPFSNIFGQMRQAEHPVWLGSDNGSPSCNGAVKDSQSTAGMDSMVSDEMFLRREMSVRGERIRLV